MSDKLSLNELESWLWEAANILRGPVDASDFKAYIFPLLFFKRISDVFDEEYEQALKDSDGDEEYASFAENHRFNVPKGAHWKDVRETPENVGQAIQYALREIEKENPKQLYGVFGDVNWTNKNRLSDALLIDLIEHFSEKDLSQKNVHPDVLGQAYEYLIKKFADLTNRKAGEFYTPRMVVHLMCSILKPQEKESIYDPACGSAGMLLEAANYVKKHGGDVRTMQLFGQEKNLTTSAIARINLFIHGIEDFQIIRDDTLRNPAFHTADELSTFDVVIANPPFSLKNWGSETWSKDPYGRNIAGTPSDSNGDFAWVQHMITSMKNPHGRMAIVLPHGALFRRGVEATIRKKLIEDDLLEAVIGLGPNLFYGTGISACILVFKLKKENEHKNKILFVDGSEEFQKGRNQNFFNQEHAEKLLSLYESFSDTEGISAVIDVKEIAKNDFNLNISRYVTKKDDREEIDLKETFAELQEAYEEFVKSENTMKELLSQVKYNE